MRTPRIFQNQSLLEGQTIELDENGSRHIGKVLRMQPGDAVIVFNGTGGEYHGAIVEADIASEERLVEAPRELDIAA